MKVSVIVAAYNVENYIKKCIKSLITQTLTDIEIIIVNDGSKDNTLNLIYEFAKNDNRILVINQENKGVMNARANGYNKATGEYVLFVDGDDWLKKDALEKLYKTAKYNNSDIVCYKFIYIDEEENQRKSHLIGDFITFNQIENEEFLKMIMLFKIIPSIWSKFIRREFITEHNINIDNNLRYAEDVALSCELGIHKPKVSMLNEHLYYYFQRSNSVTKKIDNRILDINKAVKYIKTILEVEKIYIRFKEEFEYLCFLQNYFEMMRVITDFNNKYSKELYVNWKNYNIKISKNNFITDKLNKQSKGYKILLIILNSNYLLGKIYYKIRRFG